MSLVNMIAKVYVESLVKVADNVKFPDTINGTYQDCCNEA